MKVMPSVLGQIGNDVADNLFEIGKSAVVGTAKAVTDVVGETIEQVTSTPKQIAVQNTPKNEVVDVDDSDEKKKIAEKQRFEQVKGELARYIEHKRQLDQKIAEEKAVESQQKEVGKKREHESWVSRMINRSQTTTEKGRLSE